jgi:hypothetical protein
LRIFLPDPPVELFAQLQSFAVTRIAFFTARDEEGSMSAKTLGVPVLPGTSKPVKKSGKALSLNLEISDRAKRAIEEIEANARCAEERIGSITLR